MKTYVLGTMLALASTFKDRDGNLADPTTITAKVLQPDETEVDISGTIERKSLGVYEATFTPDQEGLHYYRFEGTGGVTAAGENNFMTRTAF